MTPVVRVASASEAAARDAAAIDAGIPSRALMQRAGAAAAAEIAIRCADRLRDGVLIHAGQGNNGGDGWVVARALATVGVPVSVTETGEPRTDDAAFERRLALAHVALADYDGQAVVVDALLGTGSSGAPRGEVAHRIERMRAARERGATIVALDVPSGVDASTGERHEPSVRADLTLTFGTVKRGLLRARDATGAIVVLDIGLPADVDPAGALLVTADWVAGRLPVIGADAHKGTRRKVVIIGGAPGMAGAAALAARAALRSGIGMVRVLVASESLGAVQSSVHEALAGEWPSGEGAESSIREIISDWADAVLIGPGLGDGREARRLAGLALRAWRGPVVLDADALNVFAGDADVLGALLRDRPALITPHLMEFVRLSELERDDVQARHFDVGAELASRLGAAVLLKGVPSVITSVEGARFVSASGTPALATAGSGDVLSGIAATLIAQIGDAAAAGACAAWIHGRAAELAADGRGVRGVALSDVLDALGRAWPRDVAVPRYPVLAELPSAGEEG